MFSSTDTIWVLIASALVFFMQAGFAMVETGFTRAKNAGNIIMKNLMDFSLGSLFYWIIGFGLMFGADAAGLIGLPDFFTANSYDSNIPTYAFLIFQTVFCATAATIVSGAMAERTKFISYAIYTVIISALIYPVSGHWIWGGGWLSELGFHDFAGSTAVHMVGGVAALIGASMLGPRIGKYGKDGTPKAIPGHSLTLGALGVFILWFGWFGFNPGSSLSATGDDSILSVAGIFVTTNLAASAGAAAAMLITWIRYRKPDVSVTLNGALGGLVAITAGCDVVSASGAVLTGIIAGFIVVFGIEFIDKKLKIDDPVGAVSVHGLAGAAGTVLVGIFSIQDGLLYGGGIRLLGIQFLGVGAVGLWVAVTMTIVFSIIKRTIGLRVTKEEEIAGLDIHEHGLSSSYADFMPVVYGTSITHSHLAEVPIEKAVTVEHAGTIPASTGGIKMTKLEIITNPVKYELLKEALTSIGITGMTVTNVMGCGMQKGGTEFYRGLPVEMTLLPKVRIEVVVCKVPVEKVVEAAKKALYTGRIGDGKIFIYDVENVIKIRTGEEGFDALQDD